MGKCIFSRDTETTFKFIKNESVPDSVAVLRNLVESPFPCFFN